MNLTQSTQFFKELITRHHTLFNRLRLMHQDLSSSDKANQGHGPDHDLLVMAYTLRIADTKEIAELAWIAASLHSLDRHFGEQVERETMILLDLTTLSIEKKQTVLDAVTRHDKANSSDDSLVQIVLQDADRLANINLSMLIRSGQFRPNIPAVEIDNMSLLPGPIAGESYQKPTSCLRDISKCLEWWPEHCARHNLRTAFCIRTKAALKLAKPYFRDMERCLKNIHKAFKETGLLEIIEQIK